MSDRFQQRLQLLSEPNHLPLLAGIRRGIEKEALRVDGSGLLAQSAHPAGLGSALTHPQITTDFSEALLEFITGVHTGIDSALDELERIHRFAYGQLADGEELWTASMPCVLPGDNHIPLARYGSSNVAAMKTIYRRGLGYRYGRMMQTIAGIHYNFSLPAEVWPVLAGQDQTSAVLQDYITEQYFALIRNFRRFSWLLLYLFGASPAVCKSFLIGRSHKLLDLDAHTVHLPHATSLRMGDLGYQSSAQEQLEICYNSLENYIDTLTEAILVDHPAYREIGVKVGGEYRQLSAGLLQIENEFYSPIRPKRVTESGEIPLGALRDRGVEYIEVRCMDVDPYLPLGMDAEAIRFLDCFLLYCLLAESPLCDGPVRKEIKANLKQVVNRGREPGLALQCDGATVPMAEWADQLLQGIEAVATLLDRVHGGSAYADSCAQQRAKLEQPDLTPSARVLADLSARRRSWADFALGQSLAHSRAFRQHPLEAAEQQRFEALAAQSLADQRAVEAADSPPFDDYLANFYAQYHAL